MPRHELPRALRHNRLIIDLVGCGGTGSKLLTHLADLHLALTQLDHPGLQVTVWDPDVVSEANVGRTRFAPSHIGHNKAAVLVSQVNSVHGLLWRGVPRRYHHPCTITDRGCTSPDLVITAVDTLRARVALYHQMLADPVGPPRYWLDLGNDADYGQVILGQPKWLLDTRRDESQRLATVVDLFPAMVEQSDREEPDDPSCTLAAALGRQEADINDHMAAWGKSLIWQLFRHGGLDRNVVYVNTRLGQVGSAYRTAGNSARPAAVPALPATVERSPRRRFRTEVRR